MVEAMLATARLVGIFLDPVYSGKAIVGLFALSHSGLYGQDDMVAFLHTGSIVALFAYQTMFSLG